MTTPSLQADTVRHIAVFRALLLGDLLCATPALRALRAGFPKAQVTLVGLPWAQALVQRLASVDRLLPFSGFPGLGESPARIDALPAFLAQVQAERFDLALQMHGSGGITNPLVACFGAARTAAFHRPGEFCPEPALCVPWPESGHEVERCLALTDALGLPRQGTALDFPLVADDAARLHALWPGHAQPYVVLHAGAQLPSRRWPVERFARVAEALAASGLQVVLSGTAGEAPLAQALRRGCRRTLVDLAGRTDLWTLGALVRGARLLVSNDTGVSHVAAALGTPSVIVSLGADVRRWAPADAARHRVLWQDLPCRPCAHRSCPTGHECATAIGSDAVIEAALDLLQPCDTRPPWPTPDPTDRCASSPGMCTAITSGT